MYLIEMFERVDWGVSCLKMKYGDVGGRVSEEDGGPSDSTEDGIA
jgi:hypothetical protein